MPLPGNGGAVARQRHSPPDEFSYRSTPRRKESPKLLRLYGCAAAWLHGWTVAYIGTPCTVRGDKELDANCCLYVGVQLLIPPDPVSCMPKYYSAG
jgi:hypothetical protein